MKLKYPTKFVGITQDYKATHQAIDLCLFTTMGAGGIADLIKLAKKTGEGEE